MSQKQVFMHVICLGFSVFFLLRAWIPHLLAPSLTLFEGSGADNAACSDVQE